MERLDLGSPPLACSCSLTQDKQAQQSFVLYNSKPEKSKAKAPFALLYDTPRNRETRGEHYRIYYARDKTNVY